jgi:hypothetical protein
MAWWRDKPFECNSCGWQGMQRPREVDICPECGADLIRRTWLETWGLALLILSAVLGVVLFVAYFRQGN